MVALKAVSVRSDSHGDIVASFQGIAAVWDAYVKHIPDGRIKATDVAHMMAMLKILRASHGNETIPDHYADAAGYESIAAIIAGAEVPDAER